VPGVIQPVQQQLTGVVTHLSNGMIVPALLIARMPGRGILRPDRIKRHGFVSRRVKGKYKNV